MKKFTAEIDRTSVIITADKPGELLDTLQSMGHKVPTVERLLVHMFEDGAAYCTGQYSIYYRAAE